MLSREQNREPREAAANLAEEEYGRLRGELTRAVERMCPRWLAGQSEDLVQVGLMRVMELRRKGEDKREFSSSYLRKVAYSALVDEIRRLRRRREVPLEEESSEHEPPASAPNPERSLAGREISRAIQDCLGALVRPRRLAVTLHLQGHSVPEVARLLDWSRKRADNLVYRGGADLRRCLEAKGLKP